MPVAFTEIQQASSINLFITKTLVLKEENGRDDLQPTFISLFPECSFFILQDNPLCDCFSRIHEAKSRY